jgi:non-specific serine/threonine protein kinase
MLDTMREFACDLLADGEESDARGRHRDYFLGLAERAARDTAGHEQVSWLSWVRLETGNLRAALDYSFGTPGEELPGLRLTLALCPYWLMLGALSEGRRWHDLAIAARPGSHENAWACCWAGILAAQQGDLGTARALLDRAAAVARRVPDPVLAAYVTDAQGSVALYSGDNELAVERYGTALASFEKMGLSDLVPLTCYNRLAAACLATYDLDRAIELSDECTRRCEDAGEQWARGAAVLARAAARWVSGDHDQAIQDALAALRINEALGALRMTAMCVDLVAVCLTSRGKAAAAGSAADFARSAELRGAGDALWDIVNSPVRLGPTYTEVRRDAAARCRDVLGDEGFEAAYRRGAAMSVDEAIALARNHKPARSAAAPQPLTRREREIAALVAKGMSNREIAERLFLSKRTVDSHIEHIFAKRGFTSRTQIANWMAEASPRPVQSRPGEIPIS